MVVDLRSSRCYPTKTFVQPLSASVRAVGPQLSAGESPFPGITPGHVKDKGTQPLPPPVGMHGDHRDVGKPRQRIGAGTILIESLQDKHHRNQFAVLLGKYGESCWISKPAMNLLLGLGDAAAGHRAQRQPDLPVSGDVRRCP
jgi:hypothetical protein